MNLKEQINQDYLAAFKSGDTKSKTLLGVIKGEIQNEELRGGSVDALAIVRKMEKSLKQTNTPESLEELKIIEKYLPQLMSEMAIKVIISDYKHRGMSSMGEMMGAFNKEYKGQADNKLVSSIINEILR